MTLRIDHSPGADPRAAASPRPGKAKRLGCRRDGARRWCAPQRCSLAMPCNHCAKAGQGLASHGSRIASQIPDRNRQRIPKMLSRSSPWPLHRFPLIDTQNPDEFGQLLVSNFGAVGFDVAAEATRFEVHRSYVQLRGVHILFGACSAPYRVRFPAVPLIKQQFALHRAGRTEFGGRQFNVNQDEACIIPAGVEMMHEQQAGFESFIVRVEASALQAKLGAAIGIPVTRNIEFAHRSSFDSPGLQRLRRTLGFIVSELDRDEAKVPAAALAEFEQMLLIAFLTAN
ncbi:MAG: hypothetical protein FWD12_16485, partial [Alphaproteobacteria bacterium]|nr:hypothetical protein [Alphaproteobacteria bacterium]